MQRRADCTRVGGRWWAPWRPDVGRSCLLALCSALARQPQSVGIQRRHRFITTKKFTRGTTEAPMSVRVSTEYLLHAALITANTVANRNGSGQNVCDPRWVQTLSLQPPNIGRIRQVLDSAPAGIEQRLARSMAASLLAVADRPGEKLLPPGDLSLRHAGRKHTAAEERARRLLTSDEHASFDKAPGGVCRYCRLFDS